MGKRSDFERSPNDFYRTPEKGARPLLRMLPPGTRYIEPCAGDGRLIGHLRDAGHHCVGAYDIEPQHPSIERADALHIQSVDEERVDMFITNPPWTRSLLHPLIVHLSNMRPTWLLFDADWWHTDFPARFARGRCRMIVTIGRLKWIPGTKHQSVDNCCWYLFDKPSDAPTISIHRPHPATVGE